VIDEVRGAERALDEPRVEVDGAGLMFICWILLNPEDPNDLPNDEFLAQAPGTPATRVKTKKRGRSFLIVPPMYSFPGDFPPLF
jgi:hypothetical protein